MRQRWKLYGRKEVHQHNSHVPTIKHSGGSIIGLGLFCIFKNVRVVVSHLKLHSNLMMQEGNDPKDTSNPQKITQKKEMCILECQSDMLWLYLKRADHSRNSQIIDELNQFYGEEGSKVCPHCCAHQQLYGKCLIIYLC